MKNGTREDLRFLRETLGCVDWDAIVALGNVASYALIELGCRHFKLPHPSGQNRQLNNKSFVEARLEKLRRYIEGEYVGNGLVS